MTMVLLLALLASPSDTLTPDKRAHHALGYDEARHRVLLTGGSTPLEGGRRFVFFNDLWAFDGAGWKQLPSSGSLLSGSRLAFDRARKRVVSFGGYDGRSLPDLRVLEGDRWRTIGQLTEMPAAEPGQRRHLGARGRDLDPRAGRRSPGSAGARDGV